MAEPSRHRYCSCVIVLPWCHSRFAFPEALFHLQITHKTCSGNRLTGIHILEEHFNPVATFSTGTLLQTPEPVLGMGNMGQTKADS